MTMEGMGLSKDDDINSAGLASSAPADPALAAAGPARPAAMRDCVHAALAPRTRQAYREDRARFLAWGGQVPCAPEVGAAYLAARGASHAPATLGRGAVSLGRARTSQGLADPCRGALVQTTWRGIRRRRGNGPAPGGAAGARAAAGAAGAAGGRAARRAGSGAAGGGFRGGVARLGRRDRNRTVFHGVGTGPTGQPAPIVSQTAQPRCPSLCRTASIDR